MVTLYYHCNVDINQSLQETVLPIVMVSAIQLFYCICMLVCECVLACVWMGAGICLWLCMWVCWCIFLLVYVFVGGDYACKFVCATAWLWVWVVSRY